MIHSIKDSILDTIFQSVKGAEKLLTNTALQIHAHPELCYEERIASQLLVSKLTEIGFSVEYPYAGLETAFCARIGQGQGPQVAILAEYDALPDIGHACGHNLIAAGALGAGIGLAAIRDKLPAGEILIIGTPAEEGGGGKIRLIEAGVFKNIDAAMMFHPFDRNVLALNSLANHKIHLHFTGQPSHAAAAPWDGCSALSGIIQTFQLIDNARQHFRDGTRVHGIITDGGQAFNVIPEKASALLCARTQSLTYLEIVTQKVVDCARAAALATGTQVDIRVQTGYKNMINNMTLARLFGSYMQAVGISDYQETNPASGTFSTDMGDVSHVLPSIHPYLAICSPGESLCHQTRFAELSKSMRGFQTMINAAICLAATAYHLLSDNQVREEIKSEFIATSQ